MAAAFDDIAIEEDRSKPETPAANDAALRKVHDRALKRFDSIACPQAEIRAQSLAARRFTEIPGAQWEDEYGDLFANAPRPEIDKITPVVEKIETDYRQNRLTVDYIPSGATGDSTTADTLDGMHRADSYRCKAQQARDNAFQEALRGGFGAYRLGTDYDDPLDPDNEALRVLPGLTIVDADQSVYFDGASKLYDKRDAQWAFVVTADPVDSVKEKWGEDACPDFDTLQLRTWFEWFTPVVARIAEYYEVETVTDTRVTMTQQESGETQRFFMSDVDAKAISDLVAQGWKKKTRTVERKRVRKYILNGAKVLKDCGYIAGDMIPIVPVYGHRSFVNNMERWRGYTGKMMDRQRIYNSRAAHLLEIDSLSPFEKPIFDPEQITPQIAAMWARSNIDRHPYLLAKALRNDDGTIATLGATGKVEPPQVPQVTAALMNLASQELATDDNNADQVKANVSADAMDIAASRVDARSGIYLDNMRQSVEREGEIYLSMARDCYWEPGRKVETLSMDGKDDLATLHDLQLGADGVYQIVNDLQIGQYKVAASVQEATETRRQKTVRQCVGAAEIAIQAQDVELAQAYLITAGLNQDGEGMENLQKWLHQKAVALGIEEPSPEEKAQMEAAAQNQQPSAADTALQTQALANQAKANRDNADADLKKAQADALGGPDKVPTTPTGLQTPANDLADTLDKFASAKLKSAQADNLHHEMGLKRIKTGHDMAMERANLAQQSQEQAA